MNQPGSWLTINSGFIILWLLFNINQPCNGCSTSIVDISPTYQPTPTIYDIILVHCIVHRTTGGFIKIRIKIFVPMPAQLKTNLGGNYLTDFDPLIVTCKVGVVFYKKSSSLLNSEIGIWLKRKSKISNLNFVPSHDGQEKTRTRSRISRSTDQKYNCNFITDILKYLLSISA